MVLSQSQELILLAFQKGYRIIDGKCHSPKKKILRGTIKKHPIPYMQFSIKTNNGARSVYYHSLLAYQLYGEKYFESNVVARHKNGNSLDNSNDNIILGSQKDNKFDMTSEERKDAICKGNITKKTLNKDKIHLDYLSGMNAKQLCVKYNTCLNTMYILIRKFNKQ